MSEQAIQFGCCFCGTKGADKGLALVALDTGEFEQQWFVHTECLLDRLTRQAREAFYESNDG